MKNTIKLWLIGSMIFLILTITACDNGTGSRGTGGSGGQTGPTHADVTRANVNFRTSGSFTQAQIDALVVEFNAIDNSVMAGFTGYVFRLTRSPSGSSITMDGSGVNQRAVITASSGTILENLQAGKAAAQEARGYIGTWGGVKFYAENAADKADVLTAFNHLKAAGTEQEFIDWIDGKIHTVIVTGVDPLNTSSEPMVNGVVRGRIALNDLENTLGGIIAPSIL